MDKITVAVPCYNEEPVLDLFYSAITAVAKEFPGTEFEFLFIDDGSRAVSYTHLTHASSASPPYNNPYCLSVSNASAFCVLYSSA